MFYYVYLSSKYYSMLISKSDVSFILAPTHNVTDLRSYILRMIRKMQLVVKIDNIIRESKFDYKEYHLSQILPYP